MFPAGSYTCIDRKSSSAFIHILKIVNPQSLMPARLSANWRIRQRSTIRSRTDFRIVLKIVNPQSLINPDNLQCMNPEWIQCE